MKTLKYAFLLAMSLVIAGDLSAQVIKDPTTWTYEAKRKYGNHFEVFFHVKLAPKWHINSLNPGGDGSMIPPAFTIVKSPDVRVIGKPKELGKPKEETMEGIDGKVRLFSGEATFVQEVEVSGKGIVAVNGSHEYQVCNDQVCLPPKSKKFSINIKP